MGYTTTFEGQITVHPPLNPTEIAYLQKFAETRRMHRERGPYYVGAGGVAGQAREADIINYNQPDPGQPGLWCQWVPTEDGTALEWDGGEKFYNSEEWLRYVIAHFLTGNAGDFREQNESEGFTFDHRADGEIAAQGEDIEDRWWLKVEGNLVSRIDLPTDQKVMK